MIGSHRYVSKIEGARFTPTNLGLALICSYSRMGLELGKPYLRAAMEQECVAVAQGTKTCQAVVHDCIKEVGVSVVGVDVGAKERSMLLSCVKGGGAHEKLAIPMCAWCPCESPWAIPSGCPVRRCCPAFGGGGGHNSSPFPLPLVVFPLHSVSWISFTQLLCLCVLRPAGGRWQRCWSVSSGPRWS